jgi:hypothetical protein
MGISANTIFLISDDANEAIILYFYNYMTNSNNRRIKLYRNIKTKIYKSTIRIGKHSLSEKVLIHEICELEINEILYKDKLKFKKMNSCIAHIISPYGYNTILEPSNFMPNGKPLLELDLR